jgi:hypothetical protein
MPKKSIKNVDDARVPSKLGDCHPHGNGIPTIPGLDGYIYLSYL